MELNCDNNNNNNSNNNNDNNDNNRKGKTLVVATKKTLEIKKINFLLDFWNETALKFRSFVFNNQSSLFCCDYFLFSYYYHYRYHYYCLSYSHIIYFIFNLLLYILSSVIIILLFFCFSFLSFIHFLFWVHFCSIFFIYLLFCHFRFPLCFKWVHQVLHLHVVIFNFIPSGILWEKRQDHLNYRENSSLFCLCCCVIIGLELDNLVYTPLAHLP